MREPGSASLRERRSPRKASAGRRDHGIGVRVASTERVGRSMNPDTKRPAEGTEEMAQATRLDDVRIRQVCPLTSPALLQYDLPADEAVQGFIEGSRRQVVDVVHGKDPRLLVVVGPCSIHDADQALDYARRLQALSRELSKELLLVMRVYFEKPRTTVGWKGFINDPHLDGSFRINEGLRRARQLLLDLAHMRIAAATEFLDLLSPQYIADLVSWGAIGARTTE